MRLPSHQPTSVRRLLMIVKAKTVMRGNGQRAAFIIQIVTPVVNALHAFRKGQITTPEKLLCWQQQFNNSTTNYIACRL